MTPLPPIRMSEAMAMTLFNTGCVTMASHPATGYGSFLVLAPTSPPFFHWRKIPESSL